MHEKVSYLATHLAQSHLGEPVTLYVHASQMVVELKAMRGTRELEAEDFYQGLHPWLDNNRGTIHHIRLNVPKPLRHTTDRCIADFTNNRTPGLNEETLLVVAASLQGAKPSVQEYAVSRSGLKPEQFPIRFDEQLYRSLQAWMTRAGVEAGKVSTWTPEKIRFYTVLRDLLVITSQDVSQTLPYLLSEFHAEDRGVGTLRAFFPHLAELLGQEIEYKRRGNKVPLHRLLLELSKREVDLSRLIKETVKILHNSGRAKDLHRGGLSEELAILSSPSGKSIPTVLYEVRRDFQDDPREREYRTQARERLKQEKHPPEPINGEEVGKKWPKLEDYGLRVDHSRTRMMQKFEGMEEAIVADIRSIREHPEKYLQYQRDLVLAIAQRLQRSGQIDLRASIPSPHFSGATAELKQREEITFRAHEKLLKESSDWLWLLLYPQVQKIFLQYLPFISTPPHVTIDSQAVPVWKKEEQPRIKQAIEGGAELVNELPFLNYAFKMAEMPHEKFTYGGWRQMLTVVGDFIKLALEDGALVYLDHGTARRVASGFDPMTTSQADGFVAITQEQIYKTKPPFDVDMIVLTKEKSLGTLAKTVAEKWNSLYDSRLSYSELMGHTLQNIIFAYIAKHIGRINPDGTESKHADNTIIQNPARVLGHPSCLVNVLRGWQGRETAGKPDLLIESLLALSRFRSFGLVPFLVKLPGDNYQAMAGKLVDILGGIPLYAEMSKETGVEFGGQRRNIIDVLSYEDPFPEGMIEFYLMRTIFDVANNGVLMPKGMAWDRSGLTRWDLAQEGGREFGEVVHSFAKRLPELSEELREPRNNLVRQYMRLGWMRGALKSLETDPIAFLTLCMDYTYKNEMRGLIGVNLNEIFYHMRHLHEGGFLSKIVDKVRSTKKNPEESNSEFIARLILENPDIRQFIAQSLRNEFMQNPYVVGLKSEIIGEKGIQKDMARNWGLLDPEGLGSYVYKNAFGWFRFIKRVKDNTFLSWNEVLSGKPLHEWQKNKMKRFEEENPNEFTKLKREAILDWLVDPGF